MKKVVLLLEILLIIIFIGFRNVDAYMTGVGPIVRYEIYNENMDLETNYTASFNLVDNDFKKPEKDDYKFDGWYYDSNFTKLITKKDIANFSYSDIDNLTIYGRWIPKSNNVLYYILGTIIFIEIIIFIKIRFTIHKKAKQIIKKLRHEKTPI